MSPIAMQEIKAWMESEYAEAQGPFAAEKIGAPEFTIIRTPGYEASSSAPADDEVASVRAGIADFERGAYEDAREVSRRVRERYGL